MQENLDLALKVRDICLKNKAQWTIRINGMVEVETLQHLPIDQGYYYFKGQVKEKELEDFEYRMANRKPPD